MKLLEDSTTANRVFRASRTETFWTDRGDSLLVTGSDVRFFAQADGPLLRQALNGSVHACAISVDGKEVETLSVKKWRAANLEARESMPGSER